MDGNTALALEYQGNYGTARGNLDVADLINNPGANSLWGLGQRLTSPSKGWNGCAVTLPFIAAVTCS